MSSVGTVNPFFTPTQISGCQLWFDASDPTTFTMNAGVNVAQWREKSGNEYSVAQTTGSLQPTLLNNLQNGKAGVQFATPTFLTQTATLMPNFTSGSATSVFLAARNASANTGWNIVNTIWFAPSASGTTRYHFSFNQGATAGTTLYTNNTLVGQVTSNAVAGSSNAILGFTASSSSQTIHTNGSTNTYGGVTLPNASGTTQFIFGDNRNNAGVGSNIAIFEMIGYNVQVTTAQRQQIEGYLAWKWGLQANLPATHPYKTSPIPPLLNPPTTNPVMLQSTLPTFVPTQLPGCQLWFDGADSSTVTLSGSTVTQWRDKSGLANTTTARAGTTTFTQNAVNGLSALSFDASYFTGPFARAYTGNQVQAFAVASMSSSSLSYTRILSLGRPGVQDFNTPDATFMMCRNLGQNIMIGRNSQYLTINIPAYNTPFLVQSSHVGPIESIGVNGTLSPASQNTGVNGNFNLTSYGLGTNTSTADTNGYWSGFICEVIYYTGTLTTSQRQQVEGYLAWKWGLQTNLPSAHPYKAGPPYSTTITAPSRSIAVATMWLPNQISGCSLWFDANDSATYMISSGGVSAWTSKGSNTISVAQANTVYRPQIITRVQNGNPVVRFTNPGSANIVNLTNPSVASSVMTSGNSVFLFIVHNPTYTFNTSFSYQSGGGNRISATNPEITTGSPFMRWDWVNAVDGNGRLSFNVGSSYITEGFKQECYYVSNGAAGTSGYRKNGTLLASQPGINGSFNATQTLTIGGFEPTATQYYYRSDIAEIVLFNQDISLANVQRVEGYLAWKWGLVSSLPATHPFKLWPPPP